MIARPALLLLAAALAGPACRQDDPSRPEGLLRILQEGCAGQDAGLLLTHVDIHYQDDLGGPGRLEDDLRRLFSVYGQLNVAVEDVIVDPDAIRGHSVVEGRRMRYSGPLVLQVSKAPIGYLIQSGLFTELRGILHSLRERRLALESGAPSRLERFVSSEYRGAGGGREDLLSRLRNDLAAVSVTALMVDDLDISVQVATGHRTCARVIQSYLLVQGIGGSQTENRDRERLELCKEGSLWRFLGGLG